MRYRSAVRVAGVARRWATGAVSLALLLSAWACGSDGSTPAGSSPAPAVTYAGEWSGDVSRDTLKRKYVKFTVSGNAVVAATVEAPYLATIIRGNALTFGFCGNSMTFAGSAAIASDGTFQLQVTSSAGSTKVQGRFESPTSASGSIESFNPVAGCQGATPLSYDSDTWTAQKL